MLYHKTKFYIFEFEKYKTLNIMNKNIKEHPTGFMKWRQKLGKTICIKDMLKFTFHHLKENYSMLVSILVDIALKNPRIHSVFASILSKIRIYNIIRMIGFFTIESHTHFA
jgi:hypothetical protein